ncbi:MAG: glycosyltransferase family 4 protein [Chloroherpetonaceae bacterium]|nr:glycosyltransferase family 4 protein [Chloroherpetonaceae bacterium]
MTNHSAAPSPKRILQIITVFSIGGATASMINIASGLKLRGYEVEIVTGKNISSEGDLFQEANARGLKVTVLPNFVKEVSPIKDLLTLFQLIRFIKSGSFDVVHTHTAKAGILGRLAAYIANVPTIFHSLHLLSFHRFQHPILRFVFIFLERLVIRFTTKVISVCQTMINAHLSAGIGKPEQYTVVFNSIQNKFFSHSLDSKERLREKFGNSLGIHQNDVVITNVSRITELKGQAFILQAAPSIVKSHPEVKFLFVGGGDYLPRIKEIVTKNNLSQHVILTGVVPPERVVELLQLSDIICHTSLHEGLPTVFQEAMALKKPLVSFNLDGAAEVISDGLNGFLIPASPVNDETISILEARLISLIENPSLRISFGEQAYHKTNPYFTQSYMTDKFLEIYDSAFQTK